MLRFTDFSKNSVNPSYISTIRRCIPETRFLEAKNILYNFYDLIFRKNSLKIQKNANISKISQETYFKNHTIVISIYFANRMHRMKKTVFF